MGHSGDVGMEEIWVSAAQEGVAGSETIIVVRITRLEIDCSANAQRSQFQIVLFRVSSK